MKMIACMDQKTLAIGNNNQLIFSCKEDMARFKSYTMGKIVVMGSKTYESIGGGLKGRFNIVLTMSPKKYMAERDDAVFIRPYQFITILNLMGDTDNVVVIGGEKIYDFLIDYCDTIYLTEVLRPDFNLQYDTCFPKEIKDPNKWRRIYHSGKTVKKSFSWTHENGQEETGTICFEFVTYKKVNKK